MKHLKFAAAPNKTKNFQTVTIQILEQTHRRYDFGKNNSYSFTASNGFTIYSDGNPAEHTGTSCFVRGSHTELDNRTFELTPRSLDLFAAAVEEYNKVFAV